MQDPLREIFDCIYTERIGDHPMTKNEYAVWDAAQAILGDEFLDQMIHSQSRSLTEDQYECFRQGFRLGALLILGLN